MLRKSRCWIVLKIGTIFSYQANEEDSDANGFIEADVSPDGGEGKPINKHSRDRLDGFIDDYNGMFGTNFSTDNFYGYYKDIGKRVKARQIDILLNVIHHSDQGSQYTSIAFGLRCKEAGVRPSMGSVGDCYDNTMCESFFATLECELLDRHKFKTKAEARMACFEFIEGWYNPARRHSALGYKSPINYERRTQVTLESASP